MARRWVMADPEQPLAEHETGAGRPTMNRDPFGQLWKTISKASQIVVPSTLLASIFFYFGLRYTQDLYRQYGLDDSALGFSTPDYVERSLNVTVEPARNVAVAALAAVGSHVVLSVAFQLADSAKLGLGKRFAQLVSVLLVGGGIAGTLTFWSPGHLKLGPVASAAWWLVSVVAILYGAHLGWTRTGSTSRVTVLIRQALSSGERRVLTTLSLVLVTLLVAHGAFELTRAYAYERAVRQALRNEGTPWAFPTVRIYSRIDLALDEDLGVPEQVLEGEPGDYRYRYVNLRLFLHQNERIVLWPAHSTAREGVFILRESDDLRIEYLPSVR